uniref:Uncharacterized protein n=1 Tax=Anguilla anguilla TaxID=7936 RepID=A0A0E9SXR7_ANGAN
MCLEKDTTGGSSSGRGSASTEVLKD